MRLSDNIIEKLQPLKGINLDVAYRIFKEKRLDVKKTGFVENVIALLLDRDLPKNEKGMDFKGLFEVKEVKVNFTKREGLMRTGGDTAISAYLNSESEFKYSNIWDKSSKILIVCVDENRIVVDVRFFDGEPHFEKMKEDYERIKQFKNLCRQDNEILVFKTGRESIMLKGNTAINMSESILSDETLEIVNQDSYIRELFDDKFSSYLERTKTVLESILILMNRVSLSDLEKIRTIADIKMKESIGFDMNAGQELNF